MSPLITLFVYLIVFGLIFTLVQILINALPMIQPFKTAIYCLMVLILIVLLLDYTGLLGGAGFHGFGNCR